MDEENSLKSPQPRSIRDIGVIRPAKIANKINLQEAIEKERKENRDAPIKNIKTYQSDVADAIKKDNVSVIKMALAEKKRQDRAVVTEEKVSRESIKGIVFFALSGLLILGGIGILGYFYFANKNNSAAILVDVSKNLIYAENTSEISLNNTDLKAILTNVNTLRSNKRDNASIENVVVTEIDTSATSSGKNTKLKRTTSGEFIDFLQTTIPSPFLRSLGDQFMFGFYQNNSKPDTFLFLKITSYENAFAGMLEWEKNLPYDLYGLLALPDLSAPSVFTTASSTSSATSTIASSTKPSGLSVIALGKKPFTDKVIENRDTRVMTDQNGNTFLLYSFIDPETLVITTSENSFREILARYLQGGHEK